MKYEIDENFPLKVDLDGVPYFPNGLTKDKDGLYLLPNGKYLPRGCYVLDNGGYMIYEPVELSPYAEMLASFSK